MSDGTEIIIDAADIELVEAYNWSPRYQPSGSVYAHSGLGMLHILLAPPGAGIVDHKDRKTRNCRRTNLRRVTFQQNCQNRSRASNNTSGFKGVTFRKDRGRWLAAITINGKLTKLGLHDTAELASAAYQAAASKFFGDFDPEGDRGAPPSTTPALSPARMAGRERKAPAENQGLFD